MAMKPLNYLKMSVLAMITHGAKTYINDVI